VSGGIVSATYGLMTPNSNDILRCSICESIVHIGCMKFLSDVCENGVLQSGTDKVKIKGRDSRKKSRSKTIPPQTIVPQSNSGPIIAFINSRSGEGQGLSVFQRLQRLHAIDQVLRGRMW
jgi:hypothetical protein